MTKTLMLVLIVEYIVIGVVALVEHKPWVFGYWAMAAGLNYCILRMGLR